jgi:hypothetical protein
MKLLWWTSFRSFGISRDNDNTQRIFLNSIRNLNNTTLIVSQFGEKGVKKNLISHKVKFIFKNVNKNILPQGEKFSNQVMCHNALVEYCKKGSSYDYLVYSTCDIFIPENLTKVLNTIKLKNFIGFVFPNVLVKNGKLLKKIFPLYGIDLIVFKLSKNLAKKFLKLNYDWEQYGWGINEHYLMSMKESLDIPSVNLWKYMDIIKFENDFIGLNESRVRQIADWDKNKNYLLKYLKKNKLSNFWATGSYYYIIFKHFSFNFLSFRLLLNYILLFFQAPLIFLYKILRIKNYIK